MSDAVTEDLDDGGAEDSTPMERHVVREPRPVEGGFQTGFAVVEVGDDAVAFENFLYNEEDEAVLTQDPIVVEKEAALLSIIPLNRIYKREYKE